MGVVHTPNVDTTPIQFTPILIRQISPSPFKVKSFQASPDDPSQSQKSLTLAFVCIGARCMFLGELTPCCNITIMKKVAEGGRNRSPPLTRRF